jgi:serine/threonine protein kinase
MKPRALLERLARPFSSSRRSSSDQSRRDREEEADLEAIAAREQRAFRYETLAAATRSFSEKNRLGQGGFGPVYRGRLEDGRDVAVKRLGAGSRQGAREFRNEATLLSRVQHRNVVNLIGYCARGAEDKLLVYEYVPNESLDKILFSSSSSARCESSSVLLHCSLSLSLSPTHAVNFHAQVRAISVSCDLTTGLPLRFVGRGLDSQFVVYHHNTGRNAINPFALIENRGSRCVVGGDIFFP